ncbi:hypothetical protein D3C79_796970 [compost metagenome]
MAAAVGILQMPVLLATVDLCDPAAEIDCHILEQAAGDGTHARYANPAGLFVRRWAQDAILVVVKLRFPLCNPAGCDPLLDLIDKAPVTGSEVLRAEVQGAGIAAFAGHAATAAVPLVEQVDGLPGFLQCLGC